MKLVAANKRIARLTGEIKEIKKRISNSLNTHASNTNFSESFEDLSKLLNEKILEMMFLKARRHATNVKFNKFATIINLGELKSYIEFLRELEPKEGMITERYEEKVEFKTQLSIQNKNSMIDECQKTINLLTDELDEFNAKTDLENLESEFFLLRKDSMKKNLVTTKVIN